MKMKYWIGIVLMVIVVIVVFIIALDRKESNLPSLAERMKKSAPGPDQRPSEWDWMRRTFPYWQADAENFRQEMKKAQQMRKAASYFTLEMVQFAGPTNIQGRVSDIEFNPKNPNIVYAGAATGGVFKSTDMGQSWSAIFDDQANLNVGDIGIDPHYPDTLYVGTGEANGGHNNFPGGGVYKSTNGGASWQFLDLENTASIGRIIVDPSNSQRIFLAAVGSYFSPNPERGIYKSEDGGLTWNQSLFISDSTGAIDMVIDPTNPKRLMAAMWERVRRPNTSHLYGPTSGIYRSFDCGNFWEYLGPTNGLPNPATTDVGRIGLAISQSNPDILYALYADGSNYLELYKTDNFGTTWTNADPDREIDNGTGGFSWYFGQVRIHPTNPSTVYAMDVAFMRSIDGGANWPIIYGYGSSIPDLHVDHHALAFHPTNPDYLIEGNDGGINISTDGGVNWIKTAELPVTQFYEIGLDRNNPQRLYGGTQDNGTLRTLTGALNDWDRIYGGDGFYVIVDHNNSNIIYSESQYGNLGKSTDGGYHWSGATSGIYGNTNWSTPVIMDPNNNQVLYYGAERVFRSTNGASSWTVISPDLTLTSYPRLGTITTLAVAPTNSKVIWAGTDDGHVWVTTNYGTNWTDRTTGLPFRWVTRVVADPTDENIAYVTFSGLKWKDPQPHVFRTTNQGQNWTDISSNLPDTPINAFAIDLRRPNVLFVGTDLGAYYSTNTGQSWQYLSITLPLVSVYDMKIHETANYLAIGTHARSMYKLDLSLISDIESDQNPKLSQTFRLKQNYPNPFNPTTTIPYTILYQTQVKLAIYNSLGQEVKTLVNEEKPSGQYQISWDGRDNQGKLTAAGVYVYRLEAGGFSQSRQLTFLK
jgi:photosystem II stability/assembly factor-like uncharacterized protein